MNTFHRPTSLGRLRNESFDVVVIGAGMTGAGVAVDAAHRGLRVALIDSADIAAGTSSKSSKMVHGGLRYLQQREFRLVYENLHERQRLLKNAPHLVRILPFLIPLFGKNGAVSKALVKGYSSALRLYDMTGGWRIGKKYRKVSRQQALRHLPTLNVERLVAGFLYFDARGDDARVALTLARTAAEPFGAAVANYVRAIAFTHSAVGRVDGVMVRDELTGDEWRVATKCVVNATGVWVNDIIELDGQSTSTNITPAKGVHISVPSDRLPADVAAVLAVPGDRRSIFVVPFEEAPYTFVGTTDTPFEGDISAPFCDAGDVAYLLAAVNASTSSHLTTDDITGVWAGLRPLIAPKDGKKLRERTSDLSRRHQVHVTRDGMIHVTGGKWTTYRAMAEDAMKEVHKKVGRMKPTRTTNLRLFGAPSRSDNVKNLTGLELHLYQRFGTERQVILAMIDNDPSLASPAISGLPYTKAELLYSAEYELATSLIDILSRRCRAHIQDARATLAAAPEIAQLVAPVMKWSSDDVNREVAAFQSMVASEFAHAGLRL